MSVGICDYAFNVLDSKLTGAPQRKLRDFESDPAITAHNSPLFVTWNKLGNLRGCIGTFLSMPVEDGVARFALTLALHDLRFPAVTKQELPQLSVSVTLLANFTPIHEWDDWTVGKHGLQVEFTHQGREYGGTFLPLVAEDEEWDKETTLFYLLRKSDLFSVSKLQTVEFWKAGLADGSIELTRYEGLKASETWDEYKAKQ